MHRENVAALKPGRLGAGEVKVQHFGASMKTSMVAMLRHSLIILNDVFHGTLPRSIRFEFGSQLGIQSCQLCCECVRKSQRSRFCRALLDQSFQHFASLAAQRANLLAQGVSVLWCRLPKLRNESEQTSIQSTQSRPVGLAR